MNVRALLAIAFTLVLVALAAREPAAQPRPGGFLEQFRRMSAEAERTGLAEPFRGITATGTPEPNLFAVRSSGVSTEPVRKAAEAFLAALTPDQRRATLFPVGDDEWRKWMNQHFYIRQGVAFHEMNERQREAAFALMRAGLSAKGLTLTRDIMKLNHTLGELNDNDFEQYGEWLYHITIMGQPSASEPWGWQFDGHHAIVNYFVLGDQVVMTPFFAGSEPVIARAGKYKGTTILQEEQDRGLAFFKGLDAAQQKKATLSAAKPPNANRTEAWHDNEVIPYEGLPASEMTPAQRTQLLQLAALFIGNMDDGHARVKMAEVERHLDRTWFGWTGQTGADGTFYYRIHSPVVLIEFDHPRPINLRHLAKDPNVPTREHIHVVVRTPNGNDYGKDLLRQHYAQHPH